MVEVIAGVQHEVAEQWRRPDKVVVRCNCGDTWSQPASVTQEHLDSLFRTHLAYARRAVTRVD